MAPARAMFVAAAARRWDAVAARKVAGAVDVLPVPLDRGASGLAVVEAALDHGRPRLLKATARVHCNLAVNPRTVRAQVEGAALMALSTTLPDNAITFKEGVVQ